MLLDLTLSAREPEALEAGLVRARTALAAIGEGVKAEDRLGASAADLSLEAEPEAAKRAAEAALTGLPVDFALQSPQARRRRLFVADMDSTIVACECLDELADFAGVKAEVAAVTERSMRGEINFERALTDRTALLQGLPVSTLHRCFDERVRLNPGARTTVETLRRAGVRCVLVSGGFRPFTTRAAALAGFDQEHGNAFEIHAEALTGRVAEPILGPDAKLSILKAEASRLGETPQIALCVGDGANDLPMVRAAGLGVAYRAKPVLRAAADARIDHTDLRTLLYFQGYRDSEFAPV